MMMIPTMMNHNYHHPPTVSTTSMPSHLLFTCFFLLFPLLLLTQPCHSSTTILVDGVSTWNNPSVFVGDSVIFKHKYGYNLYIFQSFSAFTLCNFSQATLLTDPDSPSHSYSWHTSRPGFFYFAFSNGSSSSCDEQYSQKLAIKVSPQSPAPEFPPTAAPASPIPGGVVSSSPAYPWPFQPREKSAAAWAPAPEPSASAGGIYGGASAPMRVPKMLPGKGGGMPFINSNPAVPLPTGEVDSTTIRPLPTSASAGHQQMMRWRKGSIGAEMVGLWGVFLLLWLWM
ncbi:unnamed protein product [Linum tenue]|uniref:Uncharacterized protein n=1 Tax=Linum tenue TaxID=586396 RepID=A0AAV0S1C9_9ROSI|nr:unnamed protein product [Linum tenue]CAI0625696.1 unnamed protein product [Linum tenue]